MLQPLFGYTRFKLEWILNMIKVELEVILGEDMYLVFEKGVRCGISYISKRYSQSNNKHSKTYDLKQESKHIIYLDVNNLYDYAMSRFLPTSWLKWIDPEDFGLNKDQCWFFISTIMIDENLTWKTHVELVEKKIKKKIEILFKPSLSLNSKSLRSIYFALVHPHVNYANIALASTNKTYLKIILGKEKQAARLISSDDISIPLKLLMEELNILNVYQINILQNLLFTIKVKNGITLGAFNHVFSLIDHL